MKKKVKKEVGKRLKTVRGKNNLKKRKKVFDKGNLKKKVKKELSVLNRKEYEKYLKQELKVLNKISKKLLERKVLKKIRLIEDLKERLDLLKHALKSALDLKIYDLEKKIKKMEKSKKDVFFVETKLSMLKNKVRLFNAIHNKKDFNSVLGLIKEIEKEVEDV